MGMFDFGPSRQAAGKHGSNAAIVAGMPGNSTDAYFRHGQQGFDQQTGVLQAQLKNQQMAANAEGLMHLVKLFTEIHKHAMKVHKQGQSILPQDESGQPIGGGLPGFPQGSGAPQESPFQANPQSSFAGPIAGPLPKQGIRTMEDRSMNSPYYHKSSQEILDEILGGGGAPEGSGSQGYNMYNRGT